jgi:SAM-dependent methyltransferase
VTTQILDIGSGIGNEGMIKAYFGGDKDKIVTRLDINPAVKPDILHDILQPLPEEYRGKFDVVYSCHVLEHMARAEVFPVMRNMASAVRNMGEVWIIVPDIVWAAQQIVAGKDGMQVQGLLYGAQRAGNPWDLHKSGFSLRALRRMMEIIGLVVKRAYQEPFIMLMEDKQFDCVQNICIGARYDGLHEPRPEEEKTVVRTFDKGDK